ncbi:hypothetical protein [Streptomyces sp. NPDC048442]|uniref:hypothetical protein n=1 Tax=Streptomyces sp. NPDC048442 TaxID=3154823 RepID=UPI00343F1145
MTTLSRSYTLTFAQSAPTGASPPRTLTVTVATPAALAQEVHRHARGMLGSRSVDVRLDPGTLTGTVLRAHAPVADFALTPLAAPVSAPGPERRTEAVLHGYTLDDLHHLSRHVVHSDSWHTAGDIEERYDAAWYALVEYLLAAAEPPTRRDLFQAGRRGRDASIRQDQQAHGYNHHRPGNGTRPRFEQYWTTAAAHRPPPEERIIDQYALAQIWPRLTPRQQQALTALAATGDYRQSAVALGVAQSTFHVLLSTARKRFFALWHEGEQPSRMWGTDRRVGSRTATAPVKTTRRPATRAVTRRTGRPQQDLVHGRPSTYTNHACRCEPCTTAMSAAARDRSRANGATARRRITISQLADIRRRRENGESVKAIASELRYSDSYLYRLLDGTLKPAQEPV